MKKAEQLANFLADAEQMRNAFENNAAYKAAADELVSYLTATINAPPEILSRYIAEKPDTWTNALKDNLLRAKALAAYFEHQQVTTMEFLFPLDEAQDESTDPEV